MFITLLGKGIKKFEIWWRRRISVIAECQQKKCLGGSFRKDTRQAKCLSLLYTAQYLKAEFKLYVKCMILINNDNVYICIRESYWTFCTI